MKQNTKVLEEAYKKIIESKELQKEFMKATQEGKLEKFLEDLKIEATVEEVKEYLTEKFTRQDGELSKAELDLAAGGDKETAGIVGLSLVTAGVGCFVSAMKEANNQDTSGCSL